MSHDKATAKDRHETGAFTPPPRAPVAAVARELRLLERHELACPLDHSMRDKHKRLLGGVNTCTHTMPSGQICGEMSFVGGETMCIDGKKRHVVLRIRREHLEQLDRLGEPTFDRLLAVLGLD